MPSQKSQQGYFITNLFFSFVKLIVILGFILVAIVPIIYIHGTDHPHQLDQHPLYNIFQQQDYNNIIKQLNKKSSNRVLLSGSFQTGLQHFLTHYANKLTLSGKQVIMKQIVQQDQIPIQPYIKQARNFIQQNINIQPNVPTVWIILSEQSFPLSQVAQLLAKYPKDRYIVASNIQKSPQKAFQHINFPPIEQQQFKAQISVEMNIDINIVDILYKHFGSMKAIFDLLDEDQDALNLDKLLGQYQKSIRLLNDSDKTILTQICSNGVAQNVIESKALNDFGCVQFQKKYYWDNQLTRLNYEINMNLKCKSDGVISAEMRLQMQEEIRQKQLQRQRKIEQQQQKERLEKQKAKKKAKGEKNKQQVKQVGKKKPSKKKTQ